jgi:SulP family sulfate permease
MNADPPPHPPWRRNLLAGTITAVVLVPQAMAYATVVGVPPIHGLYASVLPLVAYALLARSREVALGPGALDTLLVSAGLGAVGFVTEASWPMWAAVMALMVGAIQLTLAVARAGFLVNFLSQPVISGFTSAAALVIAGSQVPNLLGMPARSAHDAVAMVRSWLDAGMAVHGLTAVVGATCLLALVGLKRVGRSSWAPLLVVGLAAAVSWLGALADHGVAVVGALPRGLPEWSWQGIGWAGVWALVPSALTVALVGYLTVISIARTFAARRGELVDANRELAALGAANVLSAASMGFPVSASFSRSAVHAGAQPASTHALLVTAAWVVLTVVVLGPLLAPLPRATLSAVIIVAVWGLIDTATPRRLWRVKRADFWLLVVTFAATLGVGVESGILIGVAASLALLLYRTTTPHVAVLGQLPGRTDYRNVLNYPEAITVPGVLVVRMDAQFYFGNVAFLRGLLMDLETRSATPLRGVILDASGLNQLDSSACDALEQVVADYHRRGIHFAMAQVKVPVKRVLDAAGLTAMIGADRFYLNVHDAVVAMVDRPESQR